MKICQAYLTLWKSTLHLNDMNTKNIIFAVVGIVILVITYWLVSPLWRNVVLDEVPPNTTTQTISQAKETKIEDKAMKSEITKTISGNFESRAHKVTGVAKVVDSSVGRVLRFENFSTVNGPDLEIYLSTDETAKDFVSLGKNKATEGNINYTIPNGTDISKYKYVLVWCKSFSINFGTSVLQ